MDVDRQSFPVQDTTLSAEALAEHARSRYGLTGPVVGRFYRKGICDTYRLWAGAERFFLKVYRQGRRTWLDVSEEVRLLRHLAANGVSVAEPVAARDGQYVDELPAPEGIRCAVLFRAAKGHADDGGNLGKIKALGDMVGRLHTCADGMTVPYQRTHLDMAHLVDDHLTVIAPRMQHRPTDLRLIEQIATRCKDQVTRSLPRSKPEYGICHGDLHGGDVCYDSQNVPTLFDFDSSGCGWRALDIGVFLASDDWMDISDAAERRRQGKLEAFLEGYASTRSLSQSELAAVQLTPAVRHVFLMGHVLRYTACYEGDHWADDGFYDWHMTWFRHWAENHH